MVALRDDDERLTGNLTPGPFPTGEGELAIVRASRVVRLHADAVAPLPLVRRDMLPENAAYPDSGCDLFASCLQGPLARCRFDAPPGGLRRLLTDARDREIALIRRRHRAPISALARTYGLTRRSIFRILSEQRAGEVGSGKREAGNENRIARSALVSDLASRFSSPASNFQHKESRHD